MMSLPYHIGNGVFGGLTPLIATRLFDVSKTADNPAGDPFIGLWYPIAIAAVCFVIGFSTYQEKQQKIYMTNRTMIASYIIHCHHSWNHLDGLNVNLIGDSTL